ncbi:MAG: ribonuclease P protein component [Erysipelotrichaceae bacterium]|nr:ribonuclease P protein component [Erysipelotrichaceae bacterium]MDD3923550.1 ribonuclease P protein component [Erysipelotrichaceae bacterium]MDD4642772.1 ribonuclease P protein component [Erysipelotrichaceae bacterium]
MKKINRVKRNEEFQKIIAQKQYVASKVFVVYYQPGLSKYFRVGISVGKKLGNAVIRNKIKRQLRMMLKDLVDLENQVDLIIIVRKPYLGKSFNDNRKDLLQLLKKVKMYGNGILNDKEIIDESI